MPPGREEEERGGGEEGRGGGLPHQGRFPSLMISDHMAEKRRGNRRRGEKISFKSGTSGGSQTSIYKSVFISVLEIDFINFLVFSFQLLDNIINCFLILLKFQGSVDVTL